ncbi:bifunctional 2',3'-cyclic-nucleotide 2'-phosphodiesterase/3'-nucleotidase [Vibrio astriarenae]|uniref:Bifunctional 2',3'-cyclic-nucleotide 2'-phosphodiesterase/3'-nucleotidase n=2 Tax=Vibrio astriarenae TaxID=1481923 RepID=A0A7Z2T5J9_9VIBR|nr:bifunctional 2',3'-cyclic-nucleotide 2'-phosphodiesterase/3'-nucleotidase [Vibrio astriarenae]
MDLRLMETTDLHSNMMPYNYFLSEEANEEAGPQAYGLSRTATLIDQARREQPNNMLFDNGDLIQGSPMGDYLADLGVEYLQEALNVHPVYKAMNYLNYDAANLGNHEFNYGLDYLAAASEGANFPYVNANVYEFNDDLARLTDEECTVDLDDHFAGNTEEFFDENKPYFQPFTILNRYFTADDGENYPVKVGVIGFTPPQILNWDERHLKCQVLLADIKMTAEHYVPKMQALGADIIVAIPHSGLTGGANNNEFQENATWQLAYVDGIDAIMFGHDHNNFPTDADVYDGMEGVDAKNGTINGVPAVMPGFWGNHLGIIDFKLESKDNGESWNIVSSKPHLKALTESTVSNVEIEFLVKGDHEGTIEFMGEEIANINDPINSFFTAVEPDISVQIVNEAQMDWGIAQQDSGALTENYPVISVSAPFKGGRGGSSDYTNIDGGVLTRASVADLYVFDNNTPAILEISAGDIIEWLEYVVAQQYVTVSKEGDRVLDENFRSYNFDIFFGGFVNEESQLNYQIDVTQDARYIVDSEDGSYELFEKNRRIKNFTFAGESFDINSEKLFYVVTNNYRASNSDMPGVKNAKIVLEDAAFTNRELVNDYLNELVEQAGGSSDELVTLEFLNAHNFSLVGGDYPVRFLSSHLDAASDYADEHLETVTPTDEFGNVGANEGYRFFEYQLTSAE